MDDLGIGYLLIIMYILCLFALPLYILLYLTIRVLRKKLIIRRFNEQVLKLSAPVAIVAMLLATLLVFAFKDAIDPLITVLFILYLASFTAGILAFLAIVVESLLNSVRNK